FVTNGYKTGYETKEEANLKTINISNEQALISAKEYLGLKSTIAFEKSETAVFYNRGNFRLAQVITIVPAEELFGEWQIMIDAQSGEIFRVEDVACYYLPQDN